MLLAFSLSTLFFVSCAGPENLLLIAAPTLENHSIHVVIENPAGSFEKWEVQSSGKLVQEFRGGAPVLIPELPWPANAGMIPRTLLSEELGGDREPLDVLVLGDPIPRGELVRAFPIGILQIVDRLERDDKIIAVRAGTPYAESESLEDLEQAFPGLREQLSRWYEVARPGSAIEVQGFGTRAAAQLLIAEGAIAFEKALRDDTLPDWDSTGGASR